MRLAFTVPVILLMLCWQAHAEPAPAMLLMTAPGEVMMSDAPTKADPPRRLPRAWYAVSLQSGSLILDRVVTTRKPDWTSTTRSTALSSDSTDAAPPAVLPARHALDMPSSALLAFRVDAAAAADKDVAFKAGFLVLNALIWGVVYILLWKGIQSLVFCIRRRMAVCF